MNEEMSFESIFNMGVGNKVEAVPETLSVERFDGSLDNIFAEATRSEEEFDFLEKFGSMESYNDALKLKMLAKINKEYGKCNRGIESYIQSCEAEVEGTSAVKEDVSGDAKLKEAPKTLKHAKWLQTALRAVAGFFVKIWTAIKNFFSTLASKIKGIFTKKKAEKTADEAAAKAKEIPATTTTTTTSSTSVTSQQNALKLIEDVNRNIAKVTPITVRLEKLVSSVSFNAGGDLENSYYQLKWKEEVSTVAMAAVKLLSQVSKIVMKGGQMISSYLKTPEKVQITGSNDFPNFVSMLTSAVVNAENVVKQINENKLKGTAGTGNKGADAAYNASIAEQKKKLGTDAYKIYETASKMAKKYVNYTAPAIQSSDFTSPSTSGKKMGQVLSQMATGLNENAIAKMDTRVGGKFLLKNLFGVKVED